MAKLDLKMGLRIFKRDAVIPDLAATYAQNTNNCTDWLISMKEFAIPAGNPQRSAFSFVLEISVIENALTAPNFD